MSTSDSTAGSQSTEQRITVHYGSTEGAKCGARSGALTLSTSMKWLNCRACIKALAREVQDANCPAENQGGAPDPKWIMVDTAQRGYAHTRYAGTCGPAVTVDDIKRRFYHSYFGGRDAWVSDGKWGATCHDD